MSTDRQEPYSLPLADLFTRLRQAGLPLGIDEYQLCIRALQHGFGRPGRTDLERLCKTLWIKSDEEERLFGYQFGQIFPFASASNSPVSSSAPSPSHSEGQDEPSVPAESPLAAPTARPELALAMGDDEVQVAIALQQTVSEESDFDYDPFIQSDEYFPLTRRQMKQSWRYLRRPVRQGPCVELDIEATINQIGHLGIFLEPVLVPLRINQAQLFFLIDQGGSMVPFHALSHRLADTALRGGRLGAANVYYFHNWPEDSVYHDPSYLEAEPLQDVLAKLSPERTVVMIFSDAGAARGSYNERRIEQTARFLEHLRQHVRSITWLNPMPRVRWVGTTASEVMSFVPMFDLSRHGLDQAINVLRGRPVLFPPRERW